MFKTVGMNARRVVLGLMAVGVLSGCELVEKTTNAVEEVGDTIVAAKNVVMDLNEQSHLKHVNLQSVLTNLTLDFSKTMVGEWDVVNYVSKDEWEGFEERGQLTIHDDGTFELVSGQVTAMDLGMTKTLSYFSGRDPGRTEVIDHNLVIFRWVENFAYPSGAHKYSRSRAVAPHSVSANKIILKGGSVSVLTRRQPESD